MKKVKKKLINLFLIIILTITSFFIGLNLYQKEDVNRDGKVDVCDLLILKKYILKEGDK